MVLGRKGNDDTGVCPTAYQAARPPGLEPQGDIAETRRIAHDRGQVRQPRGLLSQAPARGMRAGRWSTPGYSAVVDGWPAADLRMPVKQRHTATRVCTSGSWRVRVHGLVFVGAALGQALEAGASRGVGRLRRVGVGAGKRAGRFRPGQGRGRRSRTRGAFPGGVVPVFERALGGRPSRRTSGACARGLLWIFERMGMAPRVVVFDNATGVGHRRPDGTAARTRLFSLFRALRVRAAVPRPYSGHGKGSVENAVGFVRRNLMVPMPSAESFKR